MPALAAHPVSARTRRRSARARSSGSPSPVTSSSASSHDSGCTQHVSDSRARYSCSDTAWYLRDSNKRGGVCVCVCKRRGHGQRFRWAG
eukprot:361040-Chlamydomonas_euryale.AAC.6